MKLPTLKNSENKVRWYYQLISILSVLGIFFFGMYTEHKNPGIMFPAGYCDRDIPQVENNTFFGTYPLDELDDFPAYRELDAWPVNSDSNSMAPTINSGDSIIAIFNFSKEEALKVGQIVGFRISPYEIGIHRIIEVRDNGEIILRGDNNIFSDNPIVYEDIKFLVLGVVFN